MPRPRIAIHKFSSCDGCQLAFLNLGEELLAVVDISFVEGSISSSEELARIKRVREHSRYLVTIGACATAGGLQALRNLGQGGEWLASVYATPAFIDTLERVSPVREHVNVDLELWGCPVNARQVLSAIPPLLSGVLPPPEHDRVCLECKRQGHVCVVVTRGLPCLGPVTRTGCGALCPGLGRDCYGCYGPSETPAGAVLGRRFAELGLAPEAVTRRFLSFNAAAPEFLEAGGAGADRDE